MLISSLAFIYSLRRTPDLTLKKNILANYLGNFWTSLMGLVFIPSYIFYLGMESYGLIGFFAVLQASLILLDGGVTPTVSREMSRFTGGLHSPETIRDLLRTMETLIFVIACIFVFSVFISAEWIACNWLKVEKLPIEVVKNALMIMGLITALRLFEGLFRGALIGLQRQVVFNIFNSAMATLRGAGAWLMLKFFSTSILHFFYWQAFISCLTVLIFYTLVYRRIPGISRRGRFSSLELSKVWRFTAGIFISTLLAFLLTQIDKILLSRILSLKEFGKYNLAYTVANSILLLVGPVTQAHLPRLTELFSKDMRTELRQVFHQGAQMVSVIAGTAALVFWFFGETMLQDWFSAEINSSELALLAGLLMAGTLLNAFMNMPYLLQLALGKSKLVLSVNVVAVAAFIPAILYLSPTYGAFGTAWAWIALNVGYIVFASESMLSDLFPGEVRAWLIKDILKPIFPAFFVILMCRLVKPSEVSGILNLLYAFFSAMVSILIAARFSDALPKPVAQFLFSGFGDKNSGKA